MGDRTLSAPSLENQQKRDFSDFEAVLTMWKGAYPYALFSYVGVKIEQVLGLLYGRILLAPSRVASTNTDFRFETDHVIAASYVTRATTSDVASFLDSAKAGDICDAERGSVLKLIKGRDLLTDFARVHHPFFPEGQGRTPCILIHGISPSSLLGKAASQGQIDWELKAADSPFDDLDDLLTYCGLPTLAQMRDFTTLEIIASSPGFISDKSSIIAGIATIECHIAGALDISKIKVGYKVFQHKSIERSSVDGNALQFRQEGDSRIGTCQIPVQDASLIHAFLSYEDEAFHHWWIMDPQKSLNFRYGIHQVLDEELGILKRMLFKSAQDRSDAFEFAVSTLLSLLGFSTINYGLRRKLMDGPDIIAITPMGNIGVIECTVGLPDHKSKLAKVIEKTIMISSKLTAAGHSSLQILPSVVTPLPRDAVAANRHDAAKHGVALICKEDIEELLKRVVLPTDAERQFQYLKQLIPMLEQG